MTTVPESNAVPSIPSIVSAMQHIPLACIQESKTNLRGPFDDTRLADLFDFVPGNKIGVMCHPELRIIYRVT